MDWILHTPDSQFIPTPEQVKLWGTRVALEKWMNPPGHQHCFTHGPVQEQTVQKSIAVYTGHLNVAMMK